RTQRPALASIAFGWLNSDEITFDRETAMPHVFISYERENGNVVDRLAGELRSRGVTVWLDRNDPSAWHAAPGQPMTQTLLRRSPSIHAIIITCSRNWGRSTNLHAPEDVPSHAIMVGTWAEAITNVLNGVGAIVFPRTRDQLGTGWAV